MSSVTRFPRARSRRFGETVLLALVLSVISLAGSGCSPSPSLDPVARGSTTGPPDILIAVPLAVLAAWAGISIASMMGLDGRGWATALNKSALVSLSFTLLTAGFGISAALTDAAIGFPVLFAAAFLSAAGEKDTPRIRCSTDERRARLPQVRLCRVGHGAHRLHAATSGMASASPGRSTAAAATATANPCATAPHDTFNISAINVNMTLNKYGVHDPNSFMYVLNSNISAVRAEEASGQVTSGLRR